MQLTLELELQPFEVPYAVFIDNKPVLRQNGFLTREFIPLSDLSEATLDKLCEEFRLEVFKRAGRLPR